MKVRSDQGITLIELVAAMALFALVAVMGLQTLNGVLRSQTRLLSVSEDTAELSYALTLLRQDMSAMVPMLFHDPGGVPQSALHVASSGNEIAFSIGGQPNLDDLDRLDAHRVIWRYDAGQQQLTRQVWPTLQPALQRQVSPPVVVLTGVSALGIRHYQQDAGWQTWEDAPQSTVTNELPAGVELTLGTSGLGTVTLIKALN